MAGGKVLTFRTVSSENREKLDNVVTHCPFKTLIRKCNA